MSRDDVACVSCAVYVDAEFGGGWVLFSDNGAVGPGPEAYDVAGLGMSTPAWSMGAKVLTAGEAGEGLAQSAKDASFGELCVLRAVCVNAELGGLRCCSCLSPATAATLWQGRKCERSGATYMLRGWQRPALTSHRSSSSTCVPSGDGSTVGVKAVVVLVVQLLHMSPTGGI